MIPYRQPEVKNREAEAERNARIHPLIFGMPPLIDEILGIRSLQEASIWSDTPYEQDHPPENSGCFRRRRLVDRASLSPNRPPFPVRKEDRGRSGHRNATYVSHKCAHWRFQDLPDPPRS